MLIVDGPLVCRMRRSLTWPVRILALMFLACIAATTCRAFLQPRKHTVFAGYYQAGVAWTERQSPYAKYDMANGVDLFRYHPCFAMMMVPFAAVPEPVAAALWRIISGFLLLMAMMLVLEKEQERVSGFWLFLSGLPWIACSLSSLNNGQLNVAMAAMIVLAVLAATNGSWIFAGAFISVAVFFKVYPIAYLGLMLVMAPCRFAMIALGAFGFFCLLPFMMSPSGYVVGMYQTWFEFLGMDDRSRYAIKDGYRDLWMLWRLSGIPTNREAYLVLQVMAGILLASCLFILRGTFESVDRFRLAYAFGTAWCLLLGPSAESSTYILMGPWICWAIQDECGRVWTLGRVFLGGAILALVFATLGGLTRNAAQWHGLGWHPLSAILMLCRELCCLWGVRRTRSPTGWCPVKAA